MPSCLYRLLLISAITFGLILGSVSEETGEEEFDNNEIRKKRASSEPTILGLTQAQHDLSLQLHNQYRRLINASNMEKMRYNMPLAEMAFKLTKSCWMRHWWPETWPNQPFITYDIGQNLYAGTSAKLNIHVGVSGWNAEIRSYDYKTNACTDDQCGHFTQLVWGNSYLVGCASSFCPDFKRPDGTIGHNFHYYACNYGHAGNVQGQLPWKVGPACTGCDSGYFWCDNEEPRGLCVSKYNGSTSVPPGIKCTVGGCLNGGVLGCDCKCKCTAKFLGSFCEVPCVTESGCGTSYPVSYCTDYPDAMLRRCPEVCGRCGEENPQECTFPIAAPLAGSTTAEHTSHDLATSVLVDDDTMTPSTTGSSVSHTTGSAITIPFHTEDQSPAAPDTNSHTTVSIPETDEMISIFTTDKTMTNTTVSTPETDEIISISTTDKTMMINTTVSTPETDEMISISTTDNTMMINTTVSTPETDEMISLFTTDKTMVTNITVSTPERDEMVSLFTTDKTMTHSSSSLPPSYLIPTSLCIFCITGAMSLPVFIFYV